MKTLLATLSILLPAVFSADAQPVINPGGVVNAASYIRSGFPNSGIAQGSLFVVFGRNLGPAELRAFPDLPKPTSLAGTSIRIAAGGTTVGAFLYYTSSSQVAAILPSNTPLGEGTVTVTYNGVSSPPAPTRVVRSAPGIFTRNQAGHGQILEPEQPDYRQPLDAGPALNVTGPQGQRYLFRGLYGGYEAILGGGMPPRALLPEFLSPGSYGVDNGSGGTGLGSFQARLNLPPPLTWTNEAQINEVPRTADLTVTWSGGEPDREFVLIAGVSLNTVSKAQASFLCSERVTAGRFVVPATVLSSLPASSEWTGAGVPSVLAVGSQPLVADTTFTAPGLDLGLFYYLNARIKAVHYRESN